jgi:dolichol-phosphate mannosyltransferase
LGFEAAYVDVEHGARVSGRSAYSISKRVNLALYTIISMSNKPLKLAVKFGFLLSFFSLMGGIYLAVRHLIWSIPVQGWTSLMVTLCFLGGLLFLMGGVLGLYIGKIFDEVKNRPLYIIDEVINIEKE